MAFESLCCATTFSVVQILRLLFKLEMYPLFFSWNAHNTPKLHFDLSLLTKFNCFLIFFSSYPSSCFLFWMISLWQYIWIKLLILFANLNHSKNCFLINWLIFFQTNPLFNFFNENAGLILPLNFFKQASNWFLSMTSHVRSWLKSFASFVKSNKNIGGVCLLFSCFFIFHIQLTFISKIVQHLLHKHLCNCFFIFKTDFWINMLYV